MNEANSTTQILRDILNTRDPNKLQGAPSQMSANEYFRQLLEARDMSVATLALRAGRMNDKYLYQIYNGQKKNISKGIWQRIICAMGLELEEANKLLKLAGYKELWAKNKKDYWIIYGLANKLSFDDIEQLLQERSPGCSLYIYE